MAIDLGLGTCTMKYSPRGQRAADPRAAGGRPASRCRTTRRCRGCWSATGASSASCARSPASTASRSSPAAAARRCTPTRASSAPPTSSRGEGDQRNEILTTLFSHPCDAAAPATQGFKLVTLYPGPRGYPELDALRAAVYERTAGLMITNPEDTGIFNPDIEHRRASCTRPAASAPTTRPTPTASSASRGPARPASTSASSTCTRRSRRRTLDGHAVRRRRASRRELARFLPSPTVEFDGERCYLDHDRPDAIGKLRAFHGVPATVVRALAWVLALGADGLRQVAETAVLNNNYLAAQGRRDRRHRDLLRRRQRRPPAGADALHAGAARRGDGREHRGGRREDQRLRRSRSTSRATSRGWCPSR